MGEPFDFLQEIERRIRDIINNSYLSHLNENPKYKLIQTRQSLRNFLEDLKGRGK